MQLTVDFWGHVSDVDESLCCGGVVNDVSPLGVMFKIRVVGSTALLAS